MNIGMHVSFQITVLSRYMARSEIAGSYGNSIFSFFFFFINLFIYLSIYFWLCWVFASARGLSPAAASGGHSSSRCAGLSPSRLRLTGPAAPRHVGSSQTRARTRVPCTGRQILNHCATGEALVLTFNFHSKEVSIFFPVVLVLIIA